MQLLVCSRGHCIIYTHYIYIYIYTKWGPKVWDHPENVSNGLFQAVNKLSALRSVKYCTLTSFLHLATWGQPEAGRGNNLIQSSFQWCSWGRWKTWGINLSFFISLVFGSLVCSIKCPKYTPDSWREGGGQLWWRCSFFGVCDPCVCLKWFCKHNKVPIIF